MGELAFAGVQKILTLMEGKGSYHKV